MDGVAETMINLMNATSTVDHDEILDLLSAALVNQQAEAVITAFERMHLENPAGTGSMDYGSWMHFITGHWGEWWAPSASDFQEWQAMGPAHTLEDLHDAAFNDPISQFEHGVNPGQWENFVEKMYYTGEDWGTLLSPGNR